jgi:hypothetical protein
VPLALALRGGLGAWQISAALRYPSGHADGNQRQYRESGAGREDTSIAKGS